MITMNYIASFFLIFLGLYCIVVKHNAVKTVIGLCVMDYGVNIFLISVGYVPGGTAGADPHEHSYRRVRYRDEPCDSHAARRTVQDP